MRILFLSPRQAWPANSGAKLREYHLARHLAAQSELTVLAFAAEPETLRDGLSFCRNVVAVAPPTRYTPWKLLRGMFGDQPLPVLNYTDAAMRQALSGLLEQADFDLVQIEGTPMVAYAEQLRSVQRPPLIVYDWHNVESELMLRYASQPGSWPRRRYAERTARLLEATEAEMLRHGDAHLVCSTRERDHLRSIAPRACIHVTANGVDTGHFYAAEGERSADRVLFVGTFDYHANILAAVAFAREIWPLLYARLPHLRLTLAGANPAPEVRALTAIPGVEVTGTVPDLRPYYREALASVVPLRTGGGTRLKILESFAAGVPVVSTAIGAEGIAATPGQHLLLAETPAEWVTALDRLASDAAFSRGLALAARQLAEQLYDWYAIGADLREFYAELLRGRGRPVAGAST